MRCYSVYLNIWSLLNICSILFFFVIFLVNVKKTGRSRLCNLRMELPWLPLQKYAKLFESRISSFWDEFNIRMIHRSFYILHHKSKSRFFRVLNFELCSNNQSSTFVLSFTLLKTTITGTSYPISSPSLGTDASHSAEI